MVFATPENGGKITVRCDDMGLAGSVVQDMCNFLQVSELESVADFPRDMARFRGVLDRVDDHNALRLKLSAGMADASNLVKTLVVKAEDARMMLDVANMKRMYRELYALNNELVGEYVKRSTNREELKKALKEVNQFIQKSAKLRRGKAKAAVVQACRNAIRKNAMHSLMDIVKAGKASGKKA